MSTSERPRAGRPKAATSKTVKTKSRVADPVKQDHVCRESGCGRVCKSAAGLKSHHRQAHPAPPEVETPTAAVERALASIEITPKLAVLAATVRELAEALEKCEPTDKAKTSKELTARMNDLLGDAPSADESEWSEGDEE